MPEWDLIVIGAGPAGLFGTIAAAEQGRRVLLLEKSRKPGVKILMSGGTRCNLTHDTNAAGIIAAFGPNGRFLHSALARLGPRDVVDLIEAEGVPTKTEPGGKVFPASDRASDVSAAILRRLARSGAQLALSEPLVDLRKDEGGFQLSTSSRKLSAAKVLLATGGQSYPGCGTTGDGFRFAMELGHSVVPPRPALVPITSNAPWVQELSGVTMPDVRLAVLEGSGGERSSRDASVLAQRQASLLFAHFGLTGPAALDVSRAISTHPHRKSLHVECDLLPERGLKTLAAQIDEAIARAGRRDLAAIVPREVPQRVARAAVQEAGLDPTSRAAELSRLGRERLVRTLKGLAIPITGTLGFEKAEVTAGGIALAEVDSRSMESKRVAGLFLAGEVLDLDGWIGGYNFQAAFSTGWLAGETAAES